MTNGDAAARGPSLFQARKTHNHNHHHHRRLHSDFQHQHHHEQAARAPLDADSAATHIRSEQDDPLRQRQAPIVIFETVVHYIDATGSLLGVSTVEPEPSLPLPSPISPPVSVTPGLSVSGGPLPSVSLSIPAPSNGASVSSTASSLSASSVSLSASSETLTSAPSLLPSGFPSLTKGHFNSTSSRFPSLFSNSTVGIFANSTRSASLSRTTFTSSTSKSASRSSSTRLTSSTSASLFPTVINPAGGDGGPGGAAFVPTTAPTEPTSAPGPGLTPETRNAVVGGVVGGLAGIALVAFALLFILKWKKRGGNGLMLLGDGDGHLHGVGFAPQPNHGGGGAGAVAATDDSPRSGAFSIPAALARLTGNGKRAIEPAPESAMQEKGFYRVSGRKLVSVLESGGDGYSDPHASIMSGSSYYRDSQAFLDSTSLGPLQLGSPMRPDSGIPMMREGPQRTPVQEYGPNPFDSPSPTLPPVPSLDPLGRSLVMHDSSRGSGSRFTEGT